jgi:LemA protein
LDFNNKLQLFPTNMIAGMFGFKVSEFFEAEEGEKAAPKVSF